MRPGSPLTTSTAPSLAHAAHEYWPEQALDRAHTLLDLRQSGNTSLRAAYGAHLRRMLDTAARHRLDEVLAHDPLPLDEEQRTSCLYELVHKALDRMGQLSEEDRQAPPAAPLDRGLSWNLDIDEFADSQARSLPPEVICRDLARQALEEEREADRSSTTSAAAWQQQVAALDRRFGFYIPRSALLTQESPHHEPVLVRDPSLLGRHLWSALRPPPDPRARPWCLPLPALGDPDRPPRLEIDAERWARIIEPCDGGQRPRGIGIADLAPIQQACMAAPTPLTDDQRALIASTAIGASTAQERRTFPPDWLVSHQIARQFLNGMSDNDILRWLREARPAPDSTACRHLALAAVADWRHGLVMGALPELGKRTAVEAMKRDHRGDNENPRWAGRRLEHALIRSDAGRMRHITLAVLGAIGPQLSGDEAVDIFWPNRSHVPPLILGLILDKQSMLIDAHLDDLAKAVQHGHLESRHLADLLGGGVGKRGACCFGCYGPAEQHLLRRARDLRIQGLLTPQEFERVVLGDPAHPLADHIRRGLYKLVDRQCWKSDLDAFRREGLFRPSTRSSHDDPGLVASGDPSPGRATRE
ncbi:hypothetical protein [Roseateles sp.]|uniref:hypothetical protein n=1 Tax=Roseateles sp. TaxID=1971397 RepID=UPI0031E23F5E